MASTNPKLQIFLPVRENYLGAAERHERDSRYLYKDQRFESAHEHAHFCIENLIKHLVKFNKKIHVLKKGHDLLYLTDIPFNYDGLECRLAEHINADPEAKDLFETIDSAWTVHCRYYEKYLSPGDEVHIEKYWSLFQWIKSEFKI